MARIFISYKRVDNKQVFKIKDQIEAALGEKCWIDLDGIESDAQFKNVIIKAINESEVVLFMYSKAHSKIYDFEKDLTVRELNFAQKKNKRIVFVNLDGSPLSDTFEFDYGTKQQVNASSKQSIHRLIADLRRWLGIDKIQSRKAESNQKTRRFDYNIYYKHKTFLFGSIGAFLIIYSWLLLSRYSNLLYPRNAIDANNEIPGDAIVCTQCNEVGVHLDSICLVCSGRGYITEDAVYEIIKPKNGWYYYNDGTYSETIIPEKMYRCYFRHRQNIR